MTNEFDVRPPSPILIVVSGPSGVGKDTVVQRMKERGMPFHFVVTATTREKRPNETNGADYWFVSKDEFARMIEENEAEIDAPTANQIVEYLAVTYAKK